MVRSHTSATDEPELTLYQIRDPESSFGWGHDGYHGVTKNLDRRAWQHFSALKRGCHPNSKLQSAYDQCGGNLVMVRMRTGPEREILARELVLVPRQNHHWNRHRGGGPLRGLSRDEALDLIAGYQERETKEVPAHRAAGNQPARRSDGNERPGSRSSGGGGGGSADFNSSRQRSNKAGDGRPGGTGRQRTRDGASPGAGPTAGGAGVTGAAGEFAAGIGFRAALGLTAIASGMTAAVVTNRTLLKDDPSLPAAERDHRKVGRVASYVGGAGGAAAATFMAASTTAVAGIAVSIALPATVAVAAGYGCYRVARALA